MARRAYNANGECVEVEHEEYWNLAHIDRGTHYDLYGFDYEDVYKFVIVPRGTVGNQITLDDATLDAALAQLKKLEEEFDALQTQRQR